MLTPQTVRDWAEGHPNAALVAAIDAATDEQIDAALQAPRRAWEDYLDHGVSEACAEAAGAILTEVAERSYD